MAYYAKVPKALFTTALDGISTAFLKQAPNTPDPHNRLQQRYAEAILSTSEALMVAPRVTFKVYGENVVLATLLRMYGVRGLEELLDDGSVRFILWRGFIGGLQDQSLIRQGILPIVHMNLDSSEHSDPEASCLAGMKWAANFERRDRRRLARLATKKTDLTPEGAPAETWEALIEAHKNNDFTVDGLPADRPLSQTTPDEQERLVVLGGQLLEAAVLVENELDLYESDGTWRTMLQTAREVRSSGSVVSTAETILRMERVPSIRQLLLERKLTEADVLRLRRHPATAAFREWMWTRPDPGDAKAVLDEYASLFGGDKDRSLPGKFLTMIRLVGLASAGLVLGDLASGAAGAVAGVVVGTATNIAVGTGLSYFNSLLESIKDRRSPRHFSSLLRDELALREHGVAP